MIQTFNTLLSSKEQLTSDVFLVKFNLSDGQSVNFIPGQYLVMFVPTPNGEHARRLYSIASSSKESNHVEVILKIVLNGIASEYILKANLNDSVMFQGPAGRFILRNNSKNKVFLATGTGIAPIRSMIKTHLENTDNSTSYKLLWGLPTIKDVYLVDELKNITNTYTNFSFTISLSKETDLNKISETDKQYFKLGRITQNFTADLNNTDYYICGNRDVVESLKQFLYDQKIENASVIFEKF